MPAQLVPVIFIAISVLLLGATVRDYLRTEGHLTPARRAWLRVAFIFAVVGIGLILLQTVWR